RFYIGKVLDLYRKGANSHYGSIQSMTSVSTLSFLSLRVYLPLETAAAASNADDMLYEDEDVSPNAVPSFSRLPSCYQYETHTHAPASSILYHIG
ncbi:hypothetical protein DEU56DRAFT_718786, partial [Suillus clintonianus]|uniref:uncharacterized protein n=1 Tax=Suillus clintonianus TaxID=1904413 RepID=UPI001B87F01D